MEAKIQSKVGQFGVNVWWTCPEFVMDGEKAQQIIQANGFEESILPMPSRRSVVSRAAYSFQERRRKDNRKVTEKAKDNDSVVVYGILGRSQKSDEEVEYNQSTTVTLDKESGTVSAEGAQAQDFMDAFGRFEGSITDEDIRAFLRRIIKKTYGIAKRPSGGIYFVPEQFIPIVEKAQNVLDDMNMGAKLYVERIVNGVQERKIVWDAVESDIESSIEATMFAVEKIEKRAGCIQNHAAKLEELGELMDIYRNLLGQEAKYEELAERLSEASSKVAEKMTKIQQEQEGSKLQLIQEQADDDKITRKPISEDVLETVKHVLAIHGAMHFRTIAEKVENEGIELRETKTKTKAQWLQIQLDKAVRSGELDRAARGVFAVHV